MPFEDDFDIDELAMSASALLIQYRKRGINDDTERRVLNNAHDARNLERLRVLIAKFEATIQAHDAEVAAAHTALVAHASHDAHVHTHKTFGVASSSAHASSCAASSGAIHEETVCATLAAARATACPGGRARGTRRLPSDDIDRVRSEFRVFAFEAGREYYRKGNLEEIRLTAVIDSFRAKHTGRVPPSIKQGITVESWKEAVRANDINMFAAAKHVPLVKRLQRPCGRCGGRGSAGN